MMIFRGKTNHRFYLVTKVRDRYKIEDMRKGYVTFMDIFLTEYDLYKDFYKTDYSEEEVKLILAL